MLTRYFLAASGILAAATLGMSTQINACNPPCTDNDSDTYCAEKDDCDDYNANVHPGASEICDGFDDNCDGVVPTDEKDADGDSVSICAGDCDDADKATYAGATEQCDGKDNDCDKVVPATELDGDGDGFSSCQNDCDDSDSQSYPGATEQCDGKDNDCDKTVPATEADADGDTFRGCAGDCNDADKGTYPGATEVCDSADQDCDGLADATIGTTNSWLRSVCGQVLKGTPASIDANGDDQPTVIYNTNKGVFQMWFRMQDANTNPIGRIGYATSKDGATWTKYAAPDGTPKAVLDLGASGSWDAVRLGFPSVVYLNQKYYMYYQGQDASNVIRIGLATSDDGITWTRYSGNPILSAGATGTWDSKTAQAPSVIYDFSKGTWKMFYTGSDGTLLQTGYADSTDGIVWTKAPNPVVKAGPSAWDNKRVVFSRVHFYNGVYHCYYSGDDSTNTYTYEIGYAYSSDGTTWTKLGSPVFSFGAPGAWDSFSVYAAEVLPVPVGGAAGYSMFYSGASTNTGPFGIGIARKLSPSASLVAPSYGSVVRAGDVVDFVVQARDGGDLDSTTSLFYSDRDGVLGTADADLSGRLEFSTSRLSPGDHLITILTYDEGGLATTTDVEMTVR
jgi:predicted GH43/DUF377 family glycosyl hydrolase